MIGTWAYWAGALFLAIIGAVVFLIAMFKDRSRGRPRCPKCWYDMQGTSSDAPLRCPECGHNAKHRRRLHRTRRRYRVALIGVLLLATSGFLALQPKVQRDGWASLAPLTVLAAAMYYDDRDWAAPNNQPWFIVELKRRAPQMSEFRWRFRPPNSVGGLRGWDMVAFGRICHLIARDTERRNEERFFALRRAVAVAHVTGNTTYRQSTADLLIDHIYSPHWETRDLCVTGIAYIAPTDEAAATLVRIWHDEYSHAGQSTVDLAHLLRTLKLICADVTDTDAVIAVLVEALASANSDHRSAAVEAMRTLGEAGRSSPAAIEALDAARDDSRTEVRRYAISARLLMEPKASRVSLMREWVASGDDDVLMGVLDVVHLLRERDHYVPQAEIGELVLICASSLSFKVGRYARHLAFGLTAEEVAGSESLIDMFAVSDDNTLQGLAVTLRARLNKAKVER